jgi:predicted MFS family arabinose efflux permease
VEQAQGRARARSWFTQFPAALRHLALIRLIAMLGAGGVLYLTPMVFHQAQFSAGRVTEGLALAAVAGTLGRILSGVLLDRGLNCAVPVLLAALMAMAGDTRLMGAGSFDGYLQGQVLIGLAVGFYWPAIELAVPLCCAPVPSGRAFALMRSGDALGVAAGALGGAVLAWRGWLRGIYAVDIGCMLVLLQWPVGQARRPPYGGDGPEPQPAQLRRRQPAAGGLRLQRTGAGPAAARPAAPGPRGGLPRVRGLVSTPEIGEQSRRWSFSRIESAVAVQGNGVLVLS